MNENNGRARPSSYLLGAVGLLFLAAVLLIGCAQASGQTADLLPTPTPLPTPVVPEKPTYTVQRGTVINALNFNGRVSPVVEEPLSFGRQGTIKTVYVSQGDDVQAGDVLAELDLTEFEKQVREAEIALDTAVFNLEQAEEDHAESLLKMEIDLRKAELEAQKQAAEQSSISELTGKQLELQQAQETVGAAATAYQEALINDNVPQDSVDSAARGLEQAEQQLLLAEAAYQDTLSQEGAKVIDAQIQELDDMLQQMEYEKLLEGIEPSYAQEVEKAQLNLAEARQKLEDAQLIAPFDGRILSVSVRRGGTAEPLQTVMVIAQLDQVEISANLDVETLEQLSVGAQTTVRLRNRPEETLSATVRRLPYPYGGGGSAEADTDDRSVRIAVDGNPNLTLGELAEMTVVLEEKDGVLWLPPAAIRRFQGRDFVVVQDGDGQRRVDVNLGIESEDRVEILEGPAVGETVVGE